MSFDTKQIDSILGFWFGNLKEDELPSEEYRKRWWIKDHENDKRIKDDFGYDLDLAIRGELDDWKTTPPGTLALIYIEILKKLFLKIKIQLKYVSTELKRALVESFIRFKEFSTICR